MTLTVNGETRELPDHASVQDLIAELGLNDAVCAAEVNRSVVPRSTRERHILQDGDVVEIVTLVGGG